MYALTHDVASVCVVPAVLIARSLSAVLGVCAQAHAAKIWTILCFSGLVVSVPVWMMLVYASQDVSAAALKLCIMAVLARRLFTGDSRPSDRVLLVVMIVLCSLLRRETLALCAVVPIVLWACKSVGWWHALRMGLVSLTLALGIRAGIDRALVKPAYFEFGNHRLYELTSYVLTTSYLIHQDYVSGDRWADTEVFDRVVGVQGLREHYDPLLLRSQYWGNVKLPISSDTARSFRARYWRTAWNNQALFAGHRTSVLAACLTHPLRDFSIYFGRETRPESDMFLSHLALAERYRVTPGFAKHYALARWTSTLRDWSGPGPWGGPLGFLWNALPHAALVILAVVFFPLRPRTAAIMMIVAPTLAAVWLLAPEAHFKYVFDVYLAGFFVIPLWIAEGKLRDRARRSSKPIDPPSR